MSEHAAGKMTATVSAVITHADGTVEDLGVVSTSVVEAEPDEMDED